MSDQEPGGGARPSPPEPLDAEVTDWFVGTETLVAEDPRVKAGGVIAEDRPSVTQRSALCRTDPDQPLAAATGSATTAGAPGTLIFASSIDRMRGIGDLKIQIGASAIPAVQAATAARVAKASTVVCRFSNLP